MASTFTSPDLDQRIELAVQDLEYRTLSAIDSALARLVYLGSTRDYNTGRYHHDGLVYRFGEDAAAAALETCHRQAFQTILLAPLRTLAQEVEIYLNRTEDPAKTTDAWRRLKAYQLLVPVPCDPVSASLFSANIQLALGTLIVRQTARTVATPLPTGH